MSENEQMESTVDRRVARSRRRLRQALSELIAEHDYDAITVQAICDRADVGRSTFYAHYESKEDLLFSGLDEHLMRLVEEPPEGRSAERDARCFRFTLPMLRHVRLQRRFFEATILGGSDARLRDVSAGIFMDLVLAELERLAPEGLEVPGEGIDQRTLRYGYARTIVGAFMGVLDWWLRSADHVPAEVVDEILQGIIAPIPLSAPPRQSG